MTNSIGSYVRVGYSKNSVDIIVVILYVYSISIEGILVL